MQKDPSETALLSTTLWSEKRQQWKALAPLWSLRINYWTLLCIHSLLIVIHIILLAIILAGHLEHRFSIPIGSQANALQVVIVVISQLFTVTFVASSVFLIQQLALRKTFHTQQTLTAVHDTHAAWGGLGSALLTLYSQRKRATAVWGLLCVTIYLLGTSVLHITTPSLFSLATFNNTFPGYVMVTPSRPDLTSPSVTMDLDTAAYVLPMLDLLAGTNSTIGLHENIIFDVVGEARDSATQDVRPLSEDIGVNATAFHVTCGLLPQARQNGTRANTTVWNIIPSVEDSLSRFDASPIRLLTRYGIRFLPYAQGNYNTVAAQTALLYASVNVTDDQGRNGTALQLSPAIPGVPENFNVPDALHADFQPLIIACNLNLTAFQVNVDAVSRNITKDSLPNRIVRTTWQDWRAPPLSDDLLVASWGSIFNIRTLTSTPVNMCSRPQDFVGQDDDCQTFDYLTVPEKFLNDRLAIRPAGLSQNWISHEAISLKDLEMRLEEMVAAVYWSAANTPFSTTFLDPSYRPSSSRVDTRVSNPNAQLNLNLVPVVCGLSASIALLILAIVIARGPEKSTLDTELSMIGLLQFMWLLGTGSEAQTRIAEVEKPTTDDLREAAMFDVRIETLVRRGQHVEEDP